MLALPLQTLLFFLSMGASTVTHHVDVDGNRPRFIPNRLDVKKGDRVVFRFYEPNHSLIQSSLEKPCSPQIDSGSVQFNQLENLILTVTVNSLDSQWFFCRQSRFSHCHPDMLFAFNPGDQWNTFQANIQNQSSPIPSPVVTPTIVVTRTIWRFSNSTTGTTGAIGTGIIPGISSGPGTGIIPGTPINIGGTAGTGDVNGSINPTLASSPPPPFFTSEGNRLGPFSMTLFAITFAFLYFD